MLPPPYSLLATCVMRRRRRKKKHKKSKEEQELHKLEDAKREDDGAGGAADAAAGGADEGRKVEEAEEEAALKLGLELGLTPAQIAFEQNRKRRVRRVGALRTPAVAPAVGTCLRHLSAAEHGELVAHVYAWSCGGVGCSSRRQ